MLLNLLIYIVKIARKASWLSFMGIVSDIDEISTVVLGMRC